MLEYVKERGERISQGIEYVRKEFKDMNKWKLFCVAIPWGAS